MSVQRSLVLALALCSFSSVAAAQDVASPRDAAIASSRDVGPILEERLGAALAVTGGLTADQVATRAVDTSADIRARAADLQAAGLAVDQALAGYFPRVTLGASYTRLSDITMPALGTLVAAPTAQSGQPIDAATTPLVAFGFQFPVLLNQTILRAQLSIPLTDYLLRVAPGVEAAQASQDAARATSEATRRRIGSDARIAYYTWTRARLQALVADQALETIQDHLRQARSFVAAGALPEADATRVEAQVASAQLLAARAHDLDAALVDRLHTILHDGETADFAIGDGLTPSLPDVTTTPSDAVQGALDTRPELRAIAATVHAADRQAAVASAGFWPQIVGLGEVLTANPNPRFVPQQDRFDTTWSVGIGLTWSPNDLGIAVPATHAAEARRDSASAQLDAMRDAIRVEVVTAWQGVRDARAALDTTTDGLRAAEATYVARRSLYAEGRATTLELLDAEIDQTRARLEALNARVDAAIARTRWAFATGQ